MNNDMLKNLPKPFFGRREADYDCGYNSNMMLIRDVSIDNYINYCRELETIGFRRRSESTLEKCVGVTFEGNGLTVQCNYRDFEKSMRVIVDSSTILPLFEQPQISRKNPTELIQFETDHSLIDCGMCYIFRLCDGSFFIIDSAHFYSIHDEERLHDLLKSKTPKDEKIIIAGWFFSHGHDDHIDKACDYFRYMCDDTIIEALYFNFPALTHPDSKHWDQSNRNKQDNFCKFVKDSKFKCFNIHSMQHFYIRNLRIDVLCTHEDVYPQSLQNYNDSSTVIMIQTDGSKILFPGDAGHIESDIITSSFSSSTLNCDICQLSHHGHFGCKSDFYEMCNPKLLLIPNTEIKFNEEKDKMEANKTALNIADEYYISSMGTVEIPLPYQNGNVKVYPDETTEDFNGIYQLWGYEYTEKFKEKIKSDFIQRSKQSNR